MTNEEAFRNGAIVMRARIAMLLRDTGEMDLAQKLKGTELPGYSEPPHAVLEVHSGHLGHSSTRLGG